MKKKLKLFITVAITCFCFALFVFGVYSASSPSYTAMGTVSYTIDGVLLELETRIYGSSKHYSTQMELEAQAKDLEKLEFSDLNAKETLDGLNTFNKVRLFEENLSADYSETNTDFFYKYSSMETLKPPKSVELNLYYNDIEYGEANTFFIVTKVVNKTATPMYVYTQLEGTNKYTAPSNSFAYKQYGYTEVNGLDNYTYVVFAVSLVNQLKEIKDSNFSFPIGVVADINNLPKYAKADTPEYLNFEKSADQTYYSVSAGQNIADAPAGEIVIPQIYDSLPVKEIKEDGFSGVKTLTYIKIPETVTEIRTSAFSECDNLAQITMLNGITTIGYGVFYKCIKLEQVDIPDSVTTIGANAFYGCSLLKTITIPKNVTSVGLNVLGECNSVTRINYNAENLTLSVPDDVNEGLFTNVGNTNNCQFVVGNNVKSLPAKLAYGSRITVIIFGTSLETIGDKCFTGSVYLTNVNITNSIRIIGVDAFNGCTKVSNVTIGTNVGQIGEGAFSNCSSITQITYNAVNAFVKIPEGSTTEEKGAFVNSGAAMSGFVAGNEVTSIPRYLLNASKILNVKIGSGTYLIEEQALTSTVLKSIEVNTSNPYFASDSSKLCLLTHDKEILVQGTESVMAGLPTSVTEIKSYAFYKLTNLTYISLPRNVTKIGDYAFYGCSNLETVLVNGTLTVIGPNAFTGCDSLDPVPTV